MKLDAVGIDIGYSNTKGAFGDGPVPQTFVLPSGAGLADTLSEDVGVGSDRPSQAELIEIGGRQYIACIDQNYLRTKRTRHANYPLTEEYLALYYAALAKLEATEIAVLVTGVPVEQYANKKFCGQLADRLRGEHNIRKEVSVTVHEVIVTGQPVGSFADASIQLGTESDRLIIRHGHVLVEDPGYYSNDWAVFEQGRLIPSASGSNSLAMGQVLEMAAQRIEHELGDHVKPEKIEQALRSGARTILFHGEHLDYAPFLKTALNTLQRDAVTDLMNSKNLEREQFDLVLLTGGGAEYYRPIVAQAFPGTRIEVLPRAVAANARGYWLLATTRYRGSLHRVSEK